MTFLRFPKILGLAIGAALLALGAGCSSIPGADTLATMRENAPPTDNTPVFDGVGPTTMSDQTFVPRVKLPAKDPHAFSIGVVLPTDEKHLAIARSLKQGLAMAVAEVNAAGGINGQPIQLDIVDNVPGALPALRDHGEAVILVGDASLAIAAAPQLADYPQLVGFLCDYVSVPKLTPTNGVRIYLNGDQEARAMESYIETAGINRVSIVYTNNLLGQSHQQYMLYLASANHSVAAVGESYSPEENNFTLLAKAMYHSNNDALILAGNGVEYPRILAAFDAAGWNGTVFGYAGESGLAPLVNSSELALTANYPLPEFASNPRSTEASRAFADKYHVQYGEDPSLPAAYAYDNIRVLAAAAAQAASSDPKKIRESFIALRNYVGAAGRYEIKDDGDTEMPLRLWRANGQPAPEGGALAGSRRFAKTSVVQFSRARPTLSLCHVRLARRSPHPLARRNRATRRAVLSPGQAGNYRHRIRLLEKGIGSAGEKTSGTSRTFTHPNRRR